MASSNLLDKLNAMFTDAGLVKVNISDSGMTQSTPTDLSATTVSSNTPEQVCAENLERTYFFFQALHPTAVFKLSFTGPTNSYSKIIQPYQTYENPPHFCPTGPIYIEADTSGADYHAEEA